jgi:hypothetical protein
MWLVLPIFNGAAYIYRSIVRKYVKMGGVVSSTYSEDHKKALQMMTFEPRKYVKLYIDRHGLEVFERVIKAVRNRGLPENQIVCFVNMSRSGRTKGPRITLLSLDMNSGFGESPSETTREESSKNNDKDKDM